MNTVWSDFIQTTEELYQSRALRFREDNRGVWYPLLQITDHMRVLEVGCAGGLLLHRIKQANPTVIATGLDRDANHIAYAVKKSAELGLDCGFVTGDALRMPFADTSFDLVLSHTVMEHVETQPFLCEQFRVLKPGGTVLVLSVRTGLNVSPESWKPVSAREQVLFAKAWANSDEFDKEQHIGGYEMKECDYPSALEKAGFIGLDVQFMSLMSYAPDNASVPDELALAQINANRLHALESVSKALQRSPRNLTAEEREELVGLINGRFDERVEKYRKGEKVWDLATSTVMVISGKKPRCGVL